MNKRKSKSGGDTTDDEDEEEKSLFVSPNWILHNFFFLFISQMKIHSISIQFAVSYSQVIRLISIHICNNDCYERLAWKLLRVMLHMSARASPNARLSLLVGKKKTKRNRLFFGFIESIGDRCRWCDDWDEQSICRIGSDVVDACDRRYRDSFALKVSHLFLFVLNFRFTMFRIYTAVMRINVPRHHRRRRRLRVRNHRHRHRCHQQRPHFIALRLV